MQILLRLSKYLRPYLRLVLLALLTMIGSVGFDLMAPYLFKQVIDVGIADKSYKMIALLTLTLACAQLVRSVCMYVQGYTQELVGQKVVYDLRNELYRKLQKLPFSYYDKAQTGQIMSRMTGDIDAVKTFFGFGAMMMIGNAISFFGTITLMLWLQWKVTLLAMIGVPLLMLVIWQFSKRIGPAWGEVREQMGRMTSTLQENISGIRVVKSFAREHTEKKKFGGRNEDNFGSNMHRARVEAGAFPLLNLIGACIFLVLIWVGGYYVIKGEMSMGTLVAFQWYGWGLIWPLNMLGWLINIMQQAMKAAPRVFEIIDTPVEIESRGEQAVPVTDIRGRVTFDNVSLRFDKTDEQEESMILSGIDLDVKPGEVIAILGATGSGKSSLLSLISRFYDATDGRVLIDGVNVKDYELEPLRTKVGIVPQETFLFSATIKENIAYGRPEATQEEIEWAAKKAQIHDFIASMPDGYDTIIGERGVGLSGGQRQRVALARAILMDPPILVLDEATASVDTATESAIHEALHEVMQGRTTFIIAQRLSSIQRADRIIVLENGRIVEESNHKALYEKGGFFSKLFQMQRTAAES